MPETKTDNHYLADKVALRIEMTAHLPEIKLLDVFGGHGVVWAAVARLTAKQITRIPIDQRLDLMTPHLHGDNLKVLRGMNLDGFDVVDLDAYGIPAELIKTVLDSGFKGVVFVTAIQTIAGIVPKIIATDLGLPASIGTTAPSLVARHGWDFLRAWLAGLGVRQITHRSKARKHYFGFRTDQ